MALPVRLTRTTPAPGGTTTPHASWLMLAVLLLGQFMCIIDVLVTNVAMPSIAASLHASGAYALEPRSDVVGSDEVDEAGGVDETAQPNAPGARSGKPDEHDQTDNDHAHRREGCDVASHGDSFK